MRPGFEMLPVRLPCVGDVTEDLAIRARKLSPSRGSLRETPIPELLRGLHLDALDGVLLLDHGKKKKAIELRDGWPVSVRSNLISECFGRYLVDRGRCSQGQLDESIERMRGGEGFQGEILVAMEVLDNEAVALELQGHAFEKFYELFSWRDGRFEVRPGAHVQRGSRFGIQGHPSKLIVEGIRHQFPLKQIDRFLAVHQDAFLVPHADREEQIATAELSEEEALWLGALDGSTSLGALLESPESIRRIAFALITIELLGVESSAAVGATAGPVFERTSSGPKPEEELRRELAELANGMQNEDYYGVLGVASTADDEAIRGAYARLSKQTHPDRFHHASSSVRQLASQVFDRITRANAAIANAADRKIYAEELSRGRRTASVEAEGRRALKAETEFQRGEQLIALRDYQGALLCFGRAMENFPSEGEYHSHYGWCLHLCHPDNEVMLGEALEHCRDGVKLAKDREKPYLLLGRLYKVMGRTAAAKKMFTRAVEIRPQCVDAMRELRIMNMRRGKRKGVLKRFFGR